MWTVSLFKWNCVYNELHVYEYDPVLMKNTILKKLILGSLGDCNG